MAARRHTHSTRSAPRGYSCARPAAVLKQLKVRHVVTIEKEAVVWLGLLTALASICVLVMIRALGE